MSDLPDEVSVLAGEYVLGVLEASEASAVRRQADVDPALSAAILEWEERLLPLAMVIPAVAPPAELWPRLELSVAPQASVPAPSGFRRVTRGAAFWRATTAAAVALAAAFAAIAFLPPGGPGVPPRLAALSPIGAAAPAFLVEASDDGSVVLTAASPAPVPAGRDLELWLLPKGGTAVAPLGVLPSTGRKLTVPNLQTGAQLLISLEPQGGSPTGQPTGPVLYGGTLITR